jgi:hypothetical protein
LVINHRSKKSERGEKFDSSAAAKNKFQTLNFLTSQNQKPSVTKNQQHIDNHFTITQPTA